MNINLLNSALYSKLSAGTALTALLAGGTAGIYHMQAPEGAALPYVVYSWQGGGQTNEVPDLQNRIEFIRCYASSAATAGSADAAIYNLLHGQSLSITGWTTVSLQREDDYETVEIPANGSPVYTMGGLYRLILDT